MSVFHIYTRRRYIANIFFTIYKIYKNYIISDNHRWVLIFAARHDVSKYPYALLRNSRLTFQPLKFSDKKLDFPVKFSFIFFAFPACLSKRKSDSRENSWPVERLAISPRAQDRNTILTYGLNSSVTHDFRGSQVPPPSSGWR